MQAGKLRHRIVLQAGTASQNSFGELTQTWAAISGGTVWASVDALSGREFLDSRQIEAQVDYRIRIRWRDDVTERNRITWTDPMSVAHSFEIRAVLPDATSRRQLELMCAEVK